MGSAYFEWRISAARGSESIAADIARHVHSRQHLGKVVVVCDQPLVMLSAVRKQWLKLCRSIQKQRASTLNADKILKYTHTITRMQHMAFTAQPPLERPLGDLFFMTPDDVREIPQRCMTVYVLVKVPLESAQTICERITHEGLIVDYGHGTTWKELKLEPKAALERSVASEWEKLCLFLEDHKIDCGQLAGNTPQHVEAMDDALDILLGTSKTFLAIANSFQHAMEIARPLKTAKDTRAKYDAVILLAHRTQALSPGAFTQRFLESYNEDDTFFFYDSLRANYAFKGQVLTTIIERHQKAGRNRLADALLGVVFSK